MTQMITNEKFETLIYYVWLQENIKKNIEEIKYN